MTRLGFLLDSDSCIGCHACTVACKAEHDVPLGVNRTWVKYIEQGSFPAVSRHFAVMRCNHCDDAPCISICPTGALFRAGNGVVDFDDRSCIGCKGCLNACPYDAIYIDPVTSTAKKCNFCNHRLEAGLAPSCVIVCPTEAIKVGDLDDPTSEVSRIVARDDVAVRAPEQGTRPKVFYRGADQASLDPLRTAIPPDGMIWAERTAGHQSVPSGAAGVVARTTYTTAHPAPWGSKVSAYLVTKAVAAGTMLVAALLVLLGEGHRQAAAGVVPPVVAGVLLAVTGVLLVADLKQPRRFAYVLTRANRSSWLVRGAWILAGYGVALAVWLAAGIAGSSELVAVVAAPTAVLAVATAGYTAFLFGQCEGRDLWQTPLLLPTLLAQAVTAGAATVCVADLFMDVPAEGAVRWALLGGVVATAALIAVELTSSGSRHVELALDEMVRGAVSGRFWWGGVVLGLLVPGVLTAIAVAADGPALLPAVAGIAALAGMGAYEDAFVRAGQSVPLS